MDDERQNRVFLSYASEDLDKVKHVYEGLIRRGLDVWFDKEDLGPGTCKPQITRAITKSRYFIICLSNAAIRKTWDEPGFLDEVLNEAYEIAKNQPEDKFKIIPVRLEPCHRGDHRLSMQQQYDLFEDFDKGLDKLSVDLGGISLSDPTAKDERTEDEKLIDSLFAKASAEYYAGNIKQSLYLINSILIYSPDNATAWSNKAGVLSNLKQYEEALIAVDKALEIDSDYASAMFNKGAALTSLGRYEEALIFLDKGLEIYPYDAIAWNGRGQVLHRLGRNEEALQSLDKSLEIDPNNPVSWAGKGVVLIYLAEYVEALSVFNKSLEINPDDDHVSGLRDQLIKQLKDSN